MGKMKDLFIRYQQEREQREVEQFARREYDYLQSRKNNRAIPPTNQKQPKGK